MFTYYQKNIVLTIVIICLLLINQVVATKVDYNQLRAHLIAEADNMLDEHVDAPLHELMQDDMETVDMEWEFEEVAPCHQTNIVPQG